MPDFIKVLPDSVANQIAAGEVIQRPASVVKELMENAVDSGASRISVIIRDAGRTLVQIIDNGCGMSESDARISFERHATSKIRKADDLFSIRTMGFRGEAMAAIAAVAQVELKTKSREAAVGTRIVINGSEFEVQEPEGCPDGTSISVKNLFYNIPARRKFLKAQSTELNHIITEFQRVALANPDLTLILTHNNSEVYNLPAAKRLERIVNLFGKSIGQSLVSIHTETSIVKVSGYIGKPESARKRYGEQFFFTNGRFMKHPYLHRAVMQCYETLIQPNQIPPYFIFLETDPAQIDVNIHPTKTEIKFEDERAVYQIVQASVRESLGKSGLMPSLDFNQEGAIDIPIFRPGAPIVPPMISVNPDYNPFEQGASAGDREWTSNSRYTKPIPEGWQKLFATSDPNKHIDSLDQQDRLDVPSESRNWIQLKNKYIIMPVKSGVMVLNQQRAMERILFEEFLKHQGGSGNSQQLLYPVTFEVNQADLSLLEGMLPELRAIGFDLEPFGGQSVIIRGVPSLLENQDPRVLIEKLLEINRSETGLPEEQIRQQIARNLASVSSRSAVRAMAEAEMQVLIDRLFACTHPQYDPGGRLVLTILTVEELEKRLEGR